MFPILYQTVTEGTVPSDNGLGILTDALRAEVTEERNGVYELQVQYPASGIHASDISERMILKVKPNFTDDPQLFRIYKIGKVLGNSFTIYARHISYDLSGKPISSGTATNVADAFLLLNNKATNYTFNTDKTTVANFKITEPSSVRSWFGGKEGSILDVFGTGEYHYDNYTVEFLASRGTDRGVQVRYGKNLLSLSQDRDSSNIITGVIAFWKDTEGNTVIGNTISTGVTLDVPNVKTLDCSDSFENAPSVAQLDAKATAYIGNNNVSTPVNSITLNFLQIGQLKDRVDLCDTVHIIYDAFGIDATAKCVKTVWDVIKEKYISIELGEPKTNLTDTIIQQAKETKAKVSDTALQQAINTATAQITGNSGGYIVLRDTNGDGANDELLIMNTPDIATATKVWRFNLSGLGYSDTGYSGTYGLALTMSGEIVADKITTGTLKSIIIESNNYVPATSGVRLNLSDGTWRSKNFNISGTGLVSAKSLTIDDGMYIYAENSFHTAATIFSVWGSENIDGDLFPLINANERFNSQFGNIVNISADGYGIGYVNVYGITSGSIHIPHTMIKGDGTISLRDYTDKANVKERIYLDGTNGEIIVRKNNGSTNAVLIRAVTGYNNGGGVDCYNTSGTAIAYIGSNNTSGGSGQLNLSDSSGSATIQAEGSSGNIWCVRVNQSSSRKLKTNIQPITSEEANKLFELTPVTFDFKNEALGKDQRGFIAEDVEQIIPQIVSTVGDKKSIDYTEIIPYLVKVIQVQEERIKKLEDK